MSDESSLDDFHSKTATFERWIRQRLGTMISPKIQISDLRSSRAGRGIVATADIHKDEELFVIALDDVLTVQTSSLQNIRPAILERLDAWNALVLVMIHEDSQGQETSKWWPYLQILPREFDTLIYWSPAELSELEGSAVLDKIGKDSADSTFAKILLPIVQHNPELFGRYADDFRGPDARAFLLKLAHRMATLIMAYGFDLEAEAVSSDEEDEMDGSSQLAYELNKGMVPLADLFNADGDLNNAHLLQDEGSMTMIALEDIAPGQQIFNDFGQLPRSDLLRRYGYITDNYKKWDVVEIPMETITRTVSEYNKLDEQGRNSRLELAASWEVLQDAYDMSRPADDGEFILDHAMVLTITALLLTAKEFKQAPEEAPGYPPLDVLDILGEVLKQIIASTQKAYKTTIAEDNAMSKEATVQGRHRMAVEVRLGEKEILALALDEMDKILTKYERKAKVGGNANSIKRRRYN